MKKIKLDTLWQWIDEDVEKRAWFIANLVPNSFTNTAGEVCLAREILVQYGEREDVRRNLLANFFSEGWTGKASDHYKAKLANIEKKEESETDPKVKLWINEYKQRLKESIERSQTEEERDDFWG